MSENKPLTGKDFVKPSRSFKKHVILAFAGLLSFGCIYWGLLFWFAYSAYYMLFVHYTESASKMFSIFLSIIYLFMTILMLKPLFTFERKNTVKNKSIPITEKQEPDLFKFIYSIADKLKSPRPEKIFLSNRVNASVFYDLTILNLLFRSKKKLEIGLGLVNAVNKGELKAILAHEFGHFAQKSMMLGRYVYLAQQVANKIIYQRDGLDRFLQKLTSQNYRIAWIGWILCPFVWSIRSLIQITFGIVALAERYLSREMEFQADMVSVSITGSDALVHALHKIKAADQAFNATLSFIEKLLKEKKAVPDLYTLQTNYIVKMRQILNDPQYGKTPISQSDDGSHRVFKKDSTPPPQMWASHPLDYEREENAKKTYIKSEIDKETCWNLFVNPEKLRKSLTDKLLSGASINTELLDRAQSIAEQDKYEFDYMFLNPMYNGVYLSRLPFIHFKNVDAISENIKNYPNIQKDLQNIYHPQYKTKVDELAWMEKEHFSLRMVQTEDPSIEKRKIFHRGHPISKREIPRLLEELEQNIQTTREEVINYDKNARQIHLFAACKLSPLLGTYMKNILWLVHYSEHSLYNLNDILKKYSNTVSIALCDGKVTKKEMNRIQAVAHELHRTLQNIFSDSDDIKLNPALTDKLKGKQYKDLYNIFTLATPSETHMPAWNNAVWEWALMAKEGLQKLRNSSFEHLLECEDQIKCHYLNGTPIKIKTIAIKTIDNYTTLIPGNERNLQYKLSFWNQFHTGQGIIPSAAKFIAAASLIGITLLARKV